MAKPPLTFRRLVGLDRSGGPPPETRRGEPLNPWTIPNAIGIGRILLIPVFLVLALGSGDGRDTTATILFAFIATSDWFDGMAARITGQYSRLGALLDPLTDRLLVISGAIVAWELLVGRRPFEALSATEEAAAHVNAPIPSAHAANPALPAGLDAVFERALAKQPAARYDSAREPVEELRQAVHEDAGATVVVEPATVPAPPGHEATAGPGRPTRRWWIPVLLAVALAAGALAAVLAFGGGDGNDGRTIRAAVRTVVRTITTPGRTARTLQPSEGNSSAGTSICRIPRARSSSQSPTGSSGR